MMEAIGMYALSGKKVRFVNTPQIIRVNPPLAKYYLEFDEGCL